MRLRKKKNAASRYDACRDWLLTKENIAAWCDHPHLALEIGSGKGGFITKLATQNPSVRYVAVEKEVDCIVMAMEKAKAAGIDNLRFIAVDAKELGLMLPHKSFATLYLNFSDPWPKKKYAKRRLTHRNLLRHFLPLLKEDGELRFKSDNDKLFDFTVEEWRALEMEELFLTYDLHKEDVPNVMTEYETRFSQLGTPIKSMWVRPTAATFRHLEAYADEKDVFPFHQLIIDVTHFTPTDEQTLLWRALDNIGVRMARTARTTPEINNPFVRLPQEGTDLSATATALGGDASETALLSDDISLLAKAAEAGLYTIALDCHATADELWPGLSKEFLHKK